MVKRKRRKHSARSSRVAGGIAAISLVALSVGILSVQSRAGEFPNPFRKKTEVEKLAEEIDDLEEHLEEYGSVVAKQPDVWGEARLTKHRRQYEEKMERMLGKFEQTINASISRSDQAFLASATTLEVAAGAAVSKGDDSTTENESTTVNLVSTVDEVFGLEGETGRSKVKELRRAAVSDDYEGIALEPTVGLDQMSRYLYHLNHLRRINDGDDTSDSPGYALHLVRIPVSILPGEETREGYGAEITLTANPHLSKDLLPTTFRSLVINDLADQMSFAITNFLNSPEGQKVLEDFAEIHEDEQNIARKLKEDNPTLSTHAAMQLTKRLSRNGALDEQINLTRDTNQMIENVKDKRDKALASIDERLLDVELPHVASARSRQARFAFPPSQLLWVFGPDQLGHIATDCDKSLRRHPVNADVIHLPDVRSYLQAELQAAYQLLDNKPELWNLCTPELAWAIRRREHAHSVEDDAAIVHPQDDSQEGTITIEYDDRFLDVTKLRRNFLELAGDHIRHRSVAGLAWAIIVESALLNEHLIQDIREQASMKDCHSLPPGDGLPFFLPDPPAEARAIFNEYVRCRWPIHVFALDPVNQEQNVSDAYSMRRELQLAMAVGFTQGQISAQNLTRFARRIELDIDTIALHRTQVGFSHGNNTFGWRFYPRVQTPDIESNMTVFWRDLLCGGPKRDHLLKQYRLNPGARECVALILMPSFIPYAKFEMRSNWFDLTDPSDKELDTEDAVELGRAVGQARRLASTCLHDAYAYRAEDLNGLLRTIDQIETRLPFQSTMVQVPYENTLGGFEMFSSGVTDLAPELHGFYAEPGFKKEGTTTVYLMGKHFSVHETRVIAGNKDVSDNMELISRQVMQITIPNNAHVVNGRLDVHVATPYGVSNHLLVTLHNDESAKQAAAQIKDHEERLHALQLQWKDISKRDDKVIVAYHQNDATIKSMTFTNRSNPKIEQTLAQLFDFDEKKADVAAVVKVFSRGKEAPHEFVLSPAQVDVDVDLADNWLEIFTLMIENEMIPQMGENVRDHQIVPDGITHITLDVWVRSKKDGLPAVKIDTPLTITVNELDKPLNTRCCSESEAKETEKGNGQGMRDVPLPSPQNTPEDAPGSAQVKPLDDARKLRAPLAPPPVTTADGRLE